MAREITFAKLSGSGNDFICIDNRDGRLRPLLGDAAEGRAFRPLAVPATGLGVGADGVIFACRPEIEGVADVQAQFFEADGSEAELCGNGTACFVHWVIDQRLCAEAARLTHPDAGGRRPRAGTSTANTSACASPCPRTCASDLTVQADDGLWQYDFAVTGVPHAGDLRG